MTPAETKSIRAIIKALHQPRNRFGKLDGHDREAYDMFELDLCDGLPHGGADIVDQAAMLLQILVGDKPTSILDRKAVR